jgi:hypothetical protein
MILNALSKALSAIGQALEAYGRHECERPLGTCGVCFTTVYDSDPHVRNRSGIVHAEPCVERKTNSLAQ